MPPFVSNLLDAAALGRKMGLGPPMIAVWCRKVRPLALWEDNSQFKSLLETAIGHKELIRLANNYRATHTLWPSLPQLFEKALGPPTAAARALFRPLQVPGGAALESTLWSPQPASAPTGADPELADWGEAAPLPEEV